MPRNVPLDLDLGDWIEPQIILLSDADISIDVRDEREFTFRHLLDQSQHHRLVQHRFAARYFVVHALDVRRKAILGLLPCEHEKTTEALSRQECSPDDDFVARLNPEGF